MGDNPLNRPKTRSASICAATGSLETFINSTSQNFDNNGTLAFRRRKPATRSQSAKITGPRAVRKKVQGPPQQNLIGTRSYFTSEPRLNETETPPQRRKLSQRRPSVHHQTQRKSNAFLDVPTMNMHHLQINDPDDEDVDRLRTFSSSKEGVINRGDSFRRKRSRSNSLAPPSPSYSCPPSDDTLQSNDNVEAYLVLMLGSPGVGKAALVSQFRTSDCINAYDGPESEGGEHNISIILNGIESELKFVTNSNKDDLESLEKADAYLVVYSVVDKASFTRAEEILSTLQDMNFLHTRPVILVGNKIDLARSRAVSTQDGKCVACTYRAKFIEVSVGINHNCDELLAGTLTQIRLKKELNLVQGTKENTTTQHWYKSRSVVRASMKARQMITWILGKEDSKFRHCENLQVL